ncbi:MAG: tRNA lysidine(34) synthetase TilS [Methylophaga sp.]|nr:tRNA lysidine(34) synthetase TilS [Methylophaga sp.]
MTVNPQYILSEVLRLSAGRNLCLAYSGGVDSHVLLHLLASLPLEQRPKLSVIHIDHGLNADSARWAIHCQKTVEALGLNCELIKVNVTQISELGLEAAARQARYQAFRQRLTEQDCLLTAQHQQDQAETVLLQMFRGAGVRGLSAMQAVTDLAGLRVVRPLLNISRDALVAYAHQHQLNWLEDPSNDDISINRNFLRYQVMPLLVDRWPAISTTLSRTASHQADAQLLLDELAQADLVAAEVDWAAASVSISVLRQLSRQRCANALRFWLHRLGFQAPATAQLDRIMDEVFTAAIDREPLVHWHNVEVRRFHQRLYAMVAPCPQPQPIHLVDTSDISLSDNMILHWQPHRGAGLSLQTIQSGLTVVYRKGGEKIQLAGHAHHHSLKKLFQQWQIPPWQRQRIPLLFAGSELVAVVGYGWSAKHAVKDNETGWIGHTRAGQQTSFSLSDIADSGNL